MLKSALVAMGSIRFEKMTKLPEERYQIERKTVIEMISKCLDLKNEIVAG